METSRIQAGIILSLLSVHCVVHKSKDISTRHVSASRDGVISGSYNVAMHQPFAAGPITPLNEHVTVPVGNAGIMANVIAATEALFCFLNGTSEEKRTKWLCVRRMRNC